MNKRNYILPLILLFLSLGSCFLIYVQAVISPDFGFYYFWRQLIAVAVAFAVFFAIRLVPADWWKRHGFFLGSAGIFLLVAVLIFGVKINGMCGWFHWGIFSFQPNEICKPLFIIWNGWLLEYCHRKNRPLLLAGSLSLAVWCGLIALEPDFGTTAVYAITFIGTCYAIGESWKQIIAILLIIILFGALVISQRPYAIKRITDFFCDNQTESLDGNWHTQQMEISIKRGGITGVAPDAPETALPYQINDSLFAFSSERIGILGIFPLIILPLLWLAYCLRQAARFANDRFQCAILSACGILIFIQAYIHLGVNIGLLPVTGINYPLIGYGGTSILAGFILVALANPRQ